MLGERLASTGRTPDDIAEITVETHPRGLTLTEVEPPTVLSAKFSMPHAMAAVAARRTGGQSAFGRDTLDDPAIARLRHAVRLEPYAPIETWPKDRPGRVTWRLSNGETWTEAVENARGGEDEPFSTDELLGKIDELTRAVFPAMPDVLRELIVDPHAVAGKPWRDVVTQMTKLMRLRCRPMLMCWWWAQARADLLPRLLRMMPASALPSSRNSTALAATPRCRPVRCPRQAHDSSAKLVSRTRPNSSSPISFAPAGRPIVLISFEVWSRPRQKRSNGLSILWASAWCW